MGSHTMMWACQSLGSLAGSSGANIAHWQHPAWDQHGHTFVSVTTCEVPRKGMTSGETILGLG